jgi:hypothetical protein
MNPDSHPNIGSVVHDFHERLEFSARLSDETSWVGFYQGLWPDMVSSSRLDRDSEWQRDGIDRIVFLKNGRQLLIDEKKRQKTDQHGRPFLDVLLEEWSVFHRDGDQRNRIGWALDRRKRCDFVAYAIPLAHRCYLLPFELSRLAFEVHRSDWGRRFGTREAKNDGYVTRNVPVPWGTLHAAIVEQMQRSFVNPSALALPAPFVVKDQLTFKWGVE